MVGVHSSALLMVFVSTLLLSLNPATVSAADGKVDLFGKLDILLNDSATDLYIYIRWWPP